MCKLGVVFLVLAGAAGCDSTRRDFSQCDQTYNACLNGYTCDLTQGLCVPDNGQSDAAIVPVDASSIDTTIVADAADAPAVDAAPADAPPALDVAADIAIDVAQSVDLATPDLRVPDAQGTCSVDNDCVGVSGGRAYCVADKCVACKNNGQCNNDAGVPFCSAQNTCVSCTTTVIDGGAGCPASAPQCDPSSGSCVQCIQNSDCTKDPTKAFCFQNQCVGCGSVPAGTGGNDAGASTDGGSTDGGAAGTGPCTGATPVCATTGTIAGQCVGCASNADCGGPTPICSPANTCTACTSDTQCAAIPGGPGVCMFHQDGRCASDAETIYVGEFGRLYRWRRHIRVALLPSTGWNQCDHSDQARGRDDRTHRTGRLVGVADWHADFGHWAKRRHGLARRCRHRHSRRQRRCLHSRAVRAGSGTSALNAGIVVDSGATIRLDRCIVMKNAGGLLVREGAGFDVANSVFAQNQSGAVAGTASVFGGVFLGTAGAGCLHGSGSIRLPTTSNSALSARTARKP